MSPDSPISFGYKNSWLAIKSEDAEQVLKYLPIENSRPENWELGMEGVDNNELTFVSPSVEGWIFVVSRTLPELGNPDSTDRHQLLMRTLSNHFDDVQYFATDRGVDYHAWARYRAGVEEVAFAAVDSEILLNRTSLENREPVSEYKYFDVNSDESNSDEYWDREDLCHPEEEHVMAVAASWSVNPCDIDSMNLPDSTGWLGKLLLPAGPTN